jgi:DNA polymerase I-like protein with 3'-5' exonuclease and polymerase domains
MEPDVHQAARSRTGVLLHVPVKRLERAEEALAFLQSLHQQKEVVVHVARGVQGSLFGEAIESVIFGLMTGEGCLIEIPSTLIRAEKNIHDACQQLFDDVKVGFLAHDAKLQVKSLQMLKLDLGRWSFDVMLAAYLLGAGERNHDLASLAERYLGTALLADAAPIKQAEVVMGLILPLRAELEKQQLMDVLARFELPLVPVLARMEEVGIKMDRHLTKGQLSLPRKMDTLEHAQPREQKGSSYHKKIHDAGIAKSLMECIHRNLFPQKERRRYEMPRYTKR